MKLPTDKRHIQVPQDRQLCPTYVDNKKKQGFEKYIYVGSISKNKNSIFHALHLLILFR